MTRLTSGLVGGWPTVTIWNNMSSSVVHLIPIFFFTKTCSKPPTRLRIPKLQVPNPCQVLDISKTVWISRHTERDRTSIWCTWTPHCRLPKSAIQHSSYEGDSNVFKSVGWKSSVLKNAGCFEPASGWACLSCSTKRSERPAKPHWGSFARVEGHYDRLIQTCSNRHWSKLVTSVRLSALAWDDSGIASS